MRARRAFPDEYVRLGLSQEKMRGDDAQLVVFVLFPREWDEPLRVMGAMKVTVEPDDFTEEQIAEFLRENPDGLTYKITNGKLTRRRFNLLEDNFGLKKGRGS